MDNSDPQKFEFIPTTTTAEGPDKNEIPDALSDFLNPDEIAKPIHGFPDYYITSDARVISTKRKSPLEMSQFEDGGSEFAVDLRKEGHKHTRSVKRLWAEHHAEYKAPVWETYDYLLEEYDDPDVHQWADENLAPLCGSDGIGKHRDSRYLDFPKNDQGGGEK